MESPINAAIDGLVLQASLILALGAQNIYVLNSGLRRQRHLLVATICSVCDALLIFAGALGTAEVFRRAPIVKLGLGALGVVFLISYGAKKLFAQGGPAEAPPPSSASQTLVTTLGFSLLNPHVYLDTVVLIGGFAARFHTTADRLRFGAGAATFSVLWFFGLALLAARAHRVLKRSKILRGIEIISGFVLVGLGLKLGRDVYSWAVP